VSERRFTRRNEDFACAHCGRQVRGSGYTNHCPHCLWSRHVDVLPGDRSAACAGLMEPIGAQLAGGELVVVQRCVRCGHLWRNRTSPADNRDLLIALTARPTPTTPA
jgi:RNHCP domain